jgi:hypothetical protein
MPDVFSALSRATVVNRRLPSLTPIEAGRMPSMSAMAMFQQLSTARLIQFRSREQMLVKIRPPT